MMRAALISVVMVGALQSCFPLIPRCSQDTDCDPLHTCDEANGQCVTSLPGSSSSSGQSSSSAPPASSSSSGGVSSLQPGINLVGGELGGYGNADGPGPLAGFSEVTAIHPIDGALLVGDWQNGRVRRIALDGTTTTVAGNGNPQAMDGALLEGGVSDVTAFAVEGTTVYFVEHSGSCIRRMDADSLDTIAGMCGTSGFADHASDPLQARFNEPTGILVWDDGSLIISDSANHCIRMIAPGGAVTTLAGVCQQMGNVDGAQGVGKLDYPAGMVRAPDGNGILVAELGNHDIRRVTVPGGAISRFAGVPGMEAVVNGSLTDARFSRPRGLTVDDDGNIYVADTGNHVIRAIRGTTVSTLAGSAGNPGARDSDAGGQARFNTPSAIAWLDGNLYVADQENGAVRMVTTDGETSTLAGRIRERDFRAGVTPNGRFIEPNALALDASNRRIYVADDAEVRQLTIDGHLTSITMDSGLGRLGGVALSNDGETLYVTDQDNDLGHAVYQIDRTSGIITLLAGQAGMRGFVDDTGGAARFDSPGGLALAPDGTVLLADQENMRIRRIDPATGAVTTVVGNGTEDDFVDGTACSSAPIGFVSSVAVAMDGTIYFDARYAIVKAGGEPCVVSVLSGVFGGAGSVTDPVASATARYLRVSALALQGTAQLIVADAANNVVLRVSTETGDIEQVVGHPARGRTELGELPGGMNRPLGLAVMTDGSWLVSTEGAVVRVVF